MNAPAEGVRTLVLWDIDHTLIETRGIGRAIYDRAFPAATGVPLKNLANITGRTELDIMAESLRVNGLKPTNTLVQRLSDALVNQYDASRHELAAVGRALPAAHSTLKRFAADATIHQAVLTGNLREVARIKLEVFGLADYLDFDSSAFGEDHTDRARLVRIARQRAESQTKTHFEVEDIVLIGDTPNDVHAALTAGARVIGVATGKASAEDLHDAGATQVVGSLADIDL